jgi:hypothetical protein
MKGKVKKADIDYSDIELISIYLDRKISSKELSIITNKLKYNSTFRNLYVEAAEFLEDLKYRKLYKR